MQWSLRRGSQRLKKKRPPKTEAFEDKVEDANAEDAAENAVEAIWLRETVEKYLAARPPGNFTDAARMVLLEGRSQKETAEALGISRNRVNQIVRKARNEIRNQIDRQH